MEYILVTGGCGYIGSHVCVELVQKGYRVLIVDNLCNSSEDVVRRIKEITGKSDAVLFFKRDLLVDDIRPLFQEYTIQSVIHMASHKSVPESTKNPLKYYSNNIGSTINLLKCMEEMKCHQFIFSSSYCVYGDVHEVLHEDLLLTKGANPYGTTKIMIEQMLDDMPFTTVCLRYFNPLGAHESGLIGEPLANSTGLMPAILKTAIKTSAGLNVSTDDQGQSPIRDFVHVTDLARAHALTLDYMQRIPGGNVKINLGSEKETAITELIATFERVTGIPIPYTCSPLRPGDVFKILSNSQKARDVLNWQVEKTTEEMCRSAWNYIKTNSTL